MNPSPASSGSSRRGIGDPRVMEVFRRLVGLLDEHRRLYQELDTLARRQSELIEADDTDALLAVLAERQAIIDRLDHGKRRLDPARADWERISHEVSGDEREHVRLVLAEVTQLAGRVAARDEEDRRRLESRRDQIADEVVSLSRSRKAAAAYGPAGGNAGPSGLAARFQDREG